MSSAYARESQVVTEDTSVEGEDGRESFATCKPYRFKVGTSLSVAEEMIDKRFHAFREVIERTLERETERSIEGGARPVVGRVRSVVLPEAIERIVFFELGRLNLVITARGVLSAEEPRR